MTIDPTVRLTAEQRYAIVLDAAVRLANRIGLANVNHRNTAKACEVYTSIATVRHYFPRKNDLWNAILKHKDVAENVKTGSLKLGVDHERDVAGRECADTDESDTGGVD